LIALHELAYIKKAASLMGDDLLNFIVGGTTECIFIGMPPGI